MSISIVQKANGFLTNGNGTVSFANPTQTGSVVVMVLAWGYSSGGAFTFTDDAGNTVLSTSPRGFNGAHCAEGSATTASQCWVAIFQNPDDLSNYARPMQTVTSSMGVPTSVAVWLFEVAGLAQISSSSSSFYAGQYFTQDFVSSMSGGEIPSTSLLAPFGTSDVFNTPGVSDPSKSYFLLSVAAPGTIVGSPSINAVNLPWSLEPVQGGFGCAWQVSASGFNASSQKAIFTNSNSAKYCAMFESLVSSATVPPPTTGSIIIVKATSPAGDPQGFNFNPSWTTSFMLHDGQINITNGVAPGTYSIAEDALPDWSTVVTGGDPANIVVTAGSITTLTFTNTFVPPTPGGPVCFADGIIPTGAINGVNTVFTLPNAPNPPGSLILESDTSILAPGIGFTLSFILTGAQLTLVSPPKTSLVAWYRFICGSGIPPLYKLESNQFFDDNAFTGTPAAINSTYFTYGFVNSAKAAQNPLLGFHRKRYSEIQMLIRGAGQATVEAFPNYILKQDLSYNPSAYVMPPIALQTDPPDDIVRPLNISGNRVYVMFTSDAVGSGWTLSKTIMVGIIDAFSTVNPNSG